MGGIRQELESTGGGDDYDNGPYITNPSNLRDCADGTVDTINTNNDIGNRPNGSAPHSMDEWYNYNHDATSDKM